MADSGVFDWVCDQIEERSSLNRLEARGTMRLTLRDAGFEPRSVTGPQLIAVIEKLLPRELEFRAVENAAQLCLDLAAEAGARFGDAVGGTEQPEDIFARLGGGR